MYSNIPNSLNAKCKKDFLLNRFNYKFLWNIYFECSNIPKTNELYMTKKVILKEDKKWDTKYFKCVLQNEGGNYISFNLTCFKKLIKYKGRGRICKTQLGQWKHAIINHHTRKAVIKFNQIEFTNPHTIFYPLKLVWQNNTCSCRQKSSSYTIADYICLKIYLFESSQNTS